jgi:hypothetical protein
VSRGKVWLSFRTHGDPTDTRGPGCDNGIMEGPLSITRVSFLDEAYCFISRLHWAEELEELILWWLYAAPSGVDNPSHNAEQRLEESDLFP